MAGLLGQGWEDPRSAAIMSLAGGLLKGDFGGGLLGASDAFAQAKDSAFKKQFMDMQMQNMQSEIEARRLKAAQAERQQQLIGSLFPGAIPGASAATGGAPTASQGAPAGGILGLSQQLGIPVEAIQADLAFNGGKKISELLAERSKPNWQNVNGNLVNTNAPGFQGGFQAGMSTSSDGKVTAWQPDGQGGVVVGAPRGALDTFSAYQGVSEGTRARFDPVQVQAPDGSTRFVPRSEVVRPQPMGGAEADRFAILSQELQRAQAAGNAGDVAAIQAEISRLPASARMGQSPSGLAVQGGYQATPSAAQAADAAAARERAVMDARAQAERQAGRNKKADQASDMVTNIQRARALLQMDPTGSLGGMAIDKALGAFGVVTKGGNVANALETLSGWLVANVPRMEGPQSNFDVQNYAIMAARVGDRTVPVEARLAALDELERIQQRYAHLNGGSGQTSSQPQAPIGGTPPAPMKGMVRGGYRFKGGDPSKQENWEKQ